MPSQTIAVEEKTRFDTDLSPKNPHNRKAAAERGLRYDPKRRAYVDTDGSLVADRFGQPY